MSWAKLDDRFDDHRKVKRVWLACPQALGLHVMALTYCTRHETDGLVDREYVTEKAPAAKKRDAMTTALVTAGLWDEDPDGWRIHDFLDYNPSRADLDEKRRKDADRKARGRDTQSAQRPGGVRAESERNPSSVRDVSSGPVPTRPQLRPTDTVAASDDRATVDAIWDAYTATRHRVLGPRSTPQFTRDRRALIARRLKEWPAADLIDAVQGWQHFAHNRGENDRSTPYCDLELVIKDAAHIERFRDKQRGTTSESLHALAARATAAHAEAAA